MTSKVQSDNKKLSADKKSGGPKHKRTNERRLTRVFRNILLTVLAVLICAFGVAAYAAKSCSGIYPNTYVNGVKVSNMSKEELKAYLEGFYDEKKIENTSFTLTCKDKSVSVTPSDLGVSFDNNTLIGDLLASGKNGGIFKNTFAYIKRLAVPEELSPVISMDKEKLFGIIDELVKEYETEPVGHTFKIEDNSVTIIGPVNGLKADREEIANEALRQVADLKPSNIQIDLKGIKPEDINISEFYKWLTSDETDAYYEKVDGKIVVRPGKAKCKIDKKSVENAIDALKSSPNNTVTIDAEVTKPQKTTEALTETLYKDRLSSYSTNFGASSAARANNVKLATSRINGTELMPGEVFSYDDAILPRTTENGYMAAPVYVGNKVESGLGGGICQPSSTLYAAALYANLEITERHNHSLKVSYLPPGMDATIAQGVLDLKIRNNTEYPVKINATADGGVLTISIDGYNPDNISVEVQRSSKGDTYYVTRVVKKDGQVIKSEAMSKSTYGKPETDDKKKQEEKKQEDNKKEDKTVKPAEETPTEQPAETAPAETPAPVNTQLSQEASDGVLSE